MGLLILITFMTTKTHFSGKLNKSVLDPVLGPWILTQAITNSINLSSGILICMIIITYAPVVMTTIKIAWYINRFLPFLIILIFTITTYEPTTGYNSIILILAILYMICRQVKSLTTGIPKEQQYHPIKMTHRPPYELLIGTLLLICSLLGITILTKPPPA